jgi:hypothetical protein
MTHDGEQTVRVPPVATDQAALVEAIARRVVELLDEREQVAATPRGLLTPAELADALGVARSFVYQHADELGAIRLGGGSKPRLRFEWEIAKSATARSTGGRSQSEDVSNDARSRSRDARRRPRLPNDLPKPGSVLAIRGGRT